MTVITTEPGGSELPPDLAELLVCPVDQADLRLEDETLVCLACQRRYPIRDGFVDMLVETDD